MMQWNMKNRYMDKYVEKWKSWKEVWKSMWISFWDRNSCAPRNYVNPCILLGFLS